eukprot:XP_019924747.1 PREDICTED: perlucin-like protein [Crassostrea gigas]
MKLQGVSDANLPICRHTNRTPNKETVSDLFGYILVHLEWNFFMNSEYLLGLKAATWNNAQLDCSVKGAKLVEIESPEEDVYIRTLAHNLTENVWLGGTDVAEEGKWVWQSTGTIFSYSAWYVKQPNNYQNQDCLCLFRPFGINWNDISCADRYQYICERELFTN